jgi:hypothetical protein
VLVIVAVLVRMVMPMIVRSVAVIVGTVGPVDMVVIVAVVMVVAVRVVMVVRVNGAVRVPVLMAGVALDPRFAAAAAACRAHERSPRTA